jgi:hypothetical protein
MCNHAMIVGGACRPTIAGITRVSVGLLAREPVKHKYRRLSVSPSRLPPSSSSPDSTDYSCASSTSVVRRFCDIWLAFSIRLCLSLHYTNTTSPRARPSSTTTVFYRPLYAFVVQHTPPQSLSIMNMREFENLSLRPNGPNGSHQTSR